MLQLSHAIVSRPVMSLRNGTQVGTALRPIINPNNLKIEGWHCQDRFSKKQLVLLSMEVRDILPQGIVVNDHEALSDPQDLVRLQDILKLKFELLGKPVVSASKKSIGKVSDYAVEMESLYILKLYVTPSLLKSFSAGPLVVDRNQIIEITSKKIIIQDPLQATPAEATTSATAPVAP